MATIRQCVRAAFRAFDVPLERAYERDRSGWLCEPRHAAMLLSRWEGHSTVRIGRSMRRDHSTVIHGSRAAEKRALEDEEYGDRLQQAWINLDRMEGESWRNPGSTSHGGIR